MVFEIRMWEAIPQVDRDVPIVGVTDQRMQIVEREVANEAAVQLEAHA